MKKFLAILLTFVMLTGIIFSLPVTAFAEDIGEENLLANGDLVPADAKSYDRLVTDDGKWEYYLIDDEYIKIDRYVGNDEVVVIPETINNVNVTVLAHSIFWDVDSMTELRIPKTVTKIDGQLAGYCESLTSFYVDPENPEYEVRCNALVHKATNTLVQGSVATEIDADDGILVIGSGAFANFRDIEPETFVIPDTVVEICDGAFADNTSLKYINIPKSVKSIGTRVFSSCPELETITVDEDSEYYTDAGCNTLIEIETGVLLRGSNSTVIPDYVTKIDDYAFDKCEELADVTIPDTVTYIGDYAFAYCYALSEINIPAATTYVGFQTFMHCAGLAKIEVDTENSVYYGGGYNAIIERDTQKLIVGCANTVVPSGVKTIGQYAFYGNDSLIRIDLPESVQVIEYAAFGECSGLRRATIRNESCEIVDWSVDYDTPYEPGEDEGDYSTMYPDGDTITNGSLYMSRQVVIIGYPGSTAEEYATYAGRPFHDISKPLSSVVYFVNSDNWENVTAEAYFGESDESKFAPVSVKKLEDIEDLSVYVLTFDDIYDYIIFSDGSGEESPEETLYPDNYYNWENWMWYARLEDILNSGGSGDSGDSGDSGEIDPDYYAGYYLLIDRVDDSMEDYFEVVPDDSCWSYYFNTDELYPYRLDYYLENGDKIKVVYFDGESMTEFFEPDEGGWYTVECESGFKTIYFDPYGDSDWENYYIWIKDYVCNHEYNSYGVCVHCEYLKPGVKAGLSGYRVSLDGYIAVEYFMVLSDAAMESPDSAMKFMVPNGDKYTEKVLPTSYGYENHDPNEVWYIGNNKFIFTCRISAKDIASLIQAEFTTCGETIAIGDYSVKAYLESILEVYEDSKGDYDNDEDRPYYGTVPLAKAMLNYGTAAQNYFDVNLDNPANDTDYMTDEDRVIKPADFSDYAPALEGTQEGVSYYGTSLSLKSETAIKHYFYFENEEDVQNLDISSTAYPLHIAKNGSYYEFKMPNLYAQDLDEMYVLSIGDTSLTYSAFTFGYVVTNSEGNEELKDVVNAMYEFNVQAEIYSGYID